MTAFRHETVLLREVCDALVGCGRAVRYALDLTVGGGGHAQGLLSANSGLRLLGLDRDPRAVRAARERLMPFGDRARVEQASFSSFPGVLADLGFGERVDGAWRVDAIVLDAGVSSPQLDEPARGFSFRERGPLDMRMGEDGPSLSQWLEDVTVDALARVFRDYGEIGPSRRLAIALLEARDAGRLQDTLALAEVCERVLRRPGPPPRIHPATLPFQALRIAINDELGELERALEAIGPALSVGGRVAVISFHSLEDRLVKRHFRRLGRPRPLPRGLPVRGMGEEPAWREVGGLIRPSEAEASGNPRARSARLRVLERRCEETGLREVRP